jgi:hypothetical protein
MSSTVTSAGGLPRGAAAGAVRPIQPAGPRARRDRFSRPANPRGATARTRQGGAGLGLAIAAALVHAHRGTIAAGNDSPLGGARVTVEL